MRFVDRAALLRVRARRCLAATLILLVGGVLSAGSAQAGRPLVTEDAGVLEPGSCELESVGARATAPSEATERSASVQLGCGIGLRTQAALFVGHASGGGLRSDAVAVVGKSALVELTDTRAGVALAWSFAATREAGDSLAYDTSTINAVVTQPLGPWLLHANLGWTRSRLTANSLTTWSLAAERTGLGRFDLMAEVFDPGDRSRPWINAGLRYAVIEDRLFIDGSCGVSMDSPRARLLTLGLKIAI